MNRMELHPARLPIEVFLRECRATFSRASGPGGQHRNKVETAVEVTHLPTGITASATERRTQQQNRSVAVQRLRCKLAVDQRSLAASEQKDAPEPSEVWNCYCRRGRIGVAESNEHFPALLAEALDAIAQCHWEISPAAQGMETTTSQMLKLLKQYPPALQALNRERQSRGLRPLS